MQYEYPALFEKYEDEIVVSFPNVPEALTFGESLEEAYREAMDALSAALSGYAVHERTFPAPSSRRTGLVSVSPPPLIVAKLALRQRMRGLDLSNVALAKRLRVSETVVHRLLDPPHESKLANLTRALGAVGQHLVVKVEDNQNVAA